jgi:hypothetical protein
MHIPHNNFDRFLETAIQTCVGIAPSRNSGGDAGRAVGRGTGSQTGERTGLYDIEETDPVDDTPEDPEPLEEAGFTPLEEVLAAEEEKPTAKTPNDPNSRKE